MVSNIGSARRSCARCEWAEPKVNFRRHQRSKVKLFSMTCRVCGDQRAVFFDCLCGSRVMYKQKNGTVCQYNSEHFAKPERCGVKYCPRCKEELPAVLDLPTVAAHEDCVIADDETVEDVDTAEKTQEDEEEKEGATGGQDRGGRPNMPLQSSESFEAAMLEWLAAEEPLGEVLLTPDFIWYHALSVEIQANFLTRPAPEVQDTTLDIAIDIEVGGREIRPARLKLSDRSLRFAAFDPSHALPEIGYFFDANPNVERVSATALIKNGQDRSEARLISFYRRPSAEDIAKRQLIEISRLRQYQKSAQDPRYYRTTRPFSDTYSGGEPDSKKTRLQFDQYRQARLALPIWLHLAQAKRFDLLDRLKTAASDWPYYQHAILWSTAGQFLYPALRKKYISPPVQALIYAFLGCDFKVARRRKLWAVSVMSRLLWPKCKQCSAPRSFGFTHCCAACANGNHGHSISVAKHQILAVCPRIRLCASPQCTALVNNQFDFCSSDCKRFGPARARFDACKRPHCRKGCGFTVQPPRGEGDQRQLFDTCCSDCANDNGHGPECSSKPQTTLFHLTAKIHAESIRASGKFTRGPSGVYFASSIRQSDAKDEVILECRVRLGHSKQVDYQEDHSAISFASLQAHGYDSVELVGAETETFIVYNYSQIEVVQIHPASPSAAKIILS